MVRCSQRAAWRCARTLTGRLHSWRTTVSVYRLAMASVVSSEAEARCSSAPSNASSVTRPRWNSMRRTYHHAIHERHKRTPPMHANDMVYLCSWHHVVPCHADRMHLSCMTVIWSEPSCTSGVPIATSRYTHFVPRIVQHVDSALLRAQRQDLV